MVLAIFLALALPAAPIEPSVIRTTLSERSDALVVRVHPRLSLAYFPSTCGLARAWGGGDIEGGKPLGPATLEFAGERPVWTLRRGDATLPAKIEFKGYRYVDGDVRLQYRFRLPDKEVWVYETPHVVEGLNNTLELNRKFSVRGLGRNESVALELANGGGAPQIEGGTILTSPTPSDVDRLIIDPDRTIIRTRHRVDPVRPRAIPATRLLPKDAFVPVPGSPLPAWNGPFDIERFEVPDIESGVTGADFMPDGRLAVLTADGKVFLVSGLDGPDPIKLRTEAIASGLDRPTGLRVVDGRIYVVQRDELTLLKDHTGDDVTDEYYAVTGVFGADAVPVGLEARSGVFVIPMRPTPVAGAGPGRLLTFQANGAPGPTAALAGSPGGIGLGPDGRVFVTLDGDGPVAARLVAVDLASAKAQPVAWLPGTRPGQPVIFDAGPYRDQLLVSIGSDSTLTRVVLQGAAEPVQGTSLSIGSPGFVGEGFVWGPKKTLWTRASYSTKIGRLRYNFQVPFGVLGVRAMANGLEIEFTEPLGAGMGHSAGDYRIWIQRDANLAAPGDPVWSKTVTISTDRRKVFLELPNLDPKSRVKIRLNPGLSSATGRPLTGSDLSTTIDRVPAETGNVAPQVTKPNTLTPEERKDGFQLLFDGKSLDAWKGFKRDSLPGVWSVVDGEIRVAPGNDHGDIVTKDSFEDFDLRMEWKASPGANSGIFYRVAEEGDAVWWTGPEMQVLDDERHPDGKNPATSAGSQYGMYARKVASVRPADFWNEVRIVAQGKKVTYWLNGAMVNEVEIDSPDWKKRVLDSKFVQPGYGKQKSGKIALQDHGNLVSFRNIRIKRL